MNAQAIWESKWGIDVLGLGVASVLTATVAIGAFVPLVRERTLQSQAEERLEAGRAETRKLREQRSDLELNLARMEGELIATRVEVEPISRLNARISSLTDLAGKRHLTLDRLAPASPQRGAKATLLPIRMEGRGSFPECRNLISDLRVAFPDIAVSGFEISRDKAIAVDSASFVFDLIWYAEQMAQPAQPTSAK